MLKYLWLPGLMVAGLLACGDGGDTKDPNLTKDATPATASVGPDGARIFKTRCVACHGSKGDMGANGAANLQTSKISLEERIATVTHGRLDKGMQAFKGILEPDEIKAVAEYTITLKK